MASDRVNVVPADVVGVIVDFIAESGTEALLAGLVNSTWMQGVEGADELWDRLSFKQWGGRKQRGGFSMYQERMTAAFLYYPLEPAQLHAIEDCDFAFKCPLVAEALKPTGRTSESARTILHCAVCKEDVRVVSCHDGSSMGRCVMSKPQDLLRDRPRGSTPIILYSEDPKFQHEVLCTLKREKRETMYGKLDYTINLTEMIVGQFGIDLIHFVDPLQTEDSPHKHFSRVFYQGDSVPPALCTRGVTKERVVKVNDVWEAVEKICDIIHNSSHIFGMN